MIVIRIIKRITLANMFNLSKYSVRSMKSSSLQTLLRATNYSSARTTVVVQPTIEAVDSSEMVSKPSEKLTEQKPKAARTSNMVASVFATLKTDQNLVGKQRLSYTDRCIAKANSVDQLLSITDENIISRQNAMKVVSVLAQWSTSGKAKLIDFEADPRFIKLCKVLSRGSYVKMKQSPEPNIRDDDLSTVLGVTGDDEAAKLVGSITLPQMIKVMTILAQKKRRSTPLMRSLAYNISRNSMKLDIKQCADLMYSMCILNFPESVLLERISNDVSEQLENVKDKSAVVGSLLTSIGLLKYKDTVLLDALCEWVLKHNDICRPQDLFSLFITLATLNHHPVNAEQFYHTLIPHLNASDTVKNSVWLDVIWSLVVLEQATSEHVSSVLNPDFINKLQSNDHLSVSGKVKLLNINSVAKLTMKNYTGPTLDKNSDIHSVPLRRTKEKEFLVSVVLDSLGSLLPSATYLKTNVNLGLGFIIDGECVIDKKCNPHSVQETTHMSDKTRIAIQVYDYHDMCRGMPVPIGSNVLVRRLLEAQGYKLMIVPHNIFNPRDKLVQRVKYLETQLKSLASEV